LVRCFVARQFLNSLAALFFSRPTELNINIPRSLPFLNLPLLVPLPPRAQGGFIALFLLPFQAFFFQVGSERTHCFRPRQVPAAGRPQRQRSLLFLFKLLPDIFFSSSVVVVLLFAYCFHSKMRFSLHRCVTRDGGTTPCFLKGLERKQMET